MTVSWNSDPTGRHCVSCGTWTPKAKMTTARRGRFGMGSRCRKCKRTASQRSYLSEQYSITPEILVQMLTRQGGCCAICRRKIQPGVAGKQRGAAAQLGAVVDHDHATGRVRSLLCYKCNLGIGNLGDEPAALRAAADYLETAARRPCLAICGPGRCGKDTASIWLRDHTVLRYYASTSAAATELVFAALKPKYGYASAAECFQDRHNHRELWAKLIWEHNQPLGITLYVDMIKAADILNGIRRAAELQALLSAGMLDLAIWIERDVPNDPSCELTADDCDIVIQNCGTVDDLYRRLARFAAACGILR